MEHSEPKYATKGKMREMTGDGKEGEVRIWRKCCGDFFQNHQSRPLPGLSRGKAEAVSKKK